MSNRIVAVSGYFIWYHIGHVQYIEDASKYGDVVVILNSDEQQILKYGKVIVPLAERAAVLKSNKHVTAVVKSIDTDRTVCKTLERIKPNVFANGGDRTDENVPESDICEKLGIQMVFGGDKVQSSSELLLKVG